SVFFFSSRKRHTRSKRDWSSDVCSSDLITRDVEADKFLEAGLSTTTFEEKIYGVPLGMSVVPIWYNKDIFEKYDLEEPKTYDERSEERRVGKDSRARQERSEERRERIVD